MNKDLQHMSLEDLEKQQAELMTFINKRKQAQKKAALEEIRKIAVENELTFEEVTEIVRTATKRKKAPALYRNPDNPRQTWSGKGEPPLWYVNAKDPEKLRIPGT